MWIEEISKRLKICELLRHFDEETFVPIIDGMLQLFEDKVEAFIEGGNLDMKELQAYYKVRT